MKTAARQLSKRFEELRPLARMARPSRGWIRAVRESLGMTTAQLAKRLEVQQPRIIELEKAEATGNINVKSLERAAEALGCRFVYALVPIKPLTETIAERARKIARQKLAAVDQTMRLEAQGVDERTSQNEAMQQIIDELLRRPARLWDEP